MKATRLKNGGFNLNAVLIKKKRALKKARFFDFQHWKPGDGLGKYLTMRMLGGSGGSVFHLLAGFHVQKDLFGTEFTRGVFLELELGSSGLNQLKCKLIHFIKIRLKEQLSTELVMPAIGENLSNLLAADHGASDAEDDAGAAGRSIGSDLNGFFTHPFRTKTDRREIGDIIAETTLCGHLGQNSQDTGIVDTGT